MTDHLTVQEIADQTMLFLDPHQVVTVKNEEIVVDIYIVVHRVLEVLRAHNMISLEPLQPSERPSDE